MLSPFSPQISKKICIGLIGTLAIFGFTPYSYAQPSELSSESNFGDSSFGGGKSFGGRSSGTRLLESNFSDAPFGGGDGFGGSVSGTRDERCSFSAIMPTNHYSSTTKSYPTFWVYVDPNELPLAVKADLSITPLETGNEEISLESLEESASLSLEDLIDEAPPLTSTVQETLSASGFISLEVAPSTEGLVANQPYKWTITVACAESYEAIAAKSETSAKQYGSISRVSQDEMSASVQKNEHWVDTIDALARLEQPSSEATVFDAESSQLLEEWNAYLQQNTSSTDSALNPEG